MYPLHYGLHYQRGLGTRPAVCDLMSVGFMAVTVFMLRLLLGHQVLVLLLYEPILLLDPNLYVCLAAVCKCTL